MHTLYTFTLTGVLQGVGFRPYIRNAFRKAGLVGFVQNTGRGVVITANKRAPIEKILENIPGTAEVHSCTISKKSVKALPKNFTIRRSRGKGFAEVPPDFFLCKDCLRELRNPNDRRHGYYFTTCTHCGPRFTMTEKSPYDRETTSMQEFPMCEKCREEYTDPENRRYHAQTIACHDCGPKLSFYQKGKARALARDKKATELAIEKIKAGKIVAVKGVGGFHLVCLTKKKSVLELKKLTGRTDKPFAVLCRDIQEARTVATISRAEANFLTSKERPIVICKKKSVSFQNSERAVPRVSEAIFRGIEPKNIRNLEHGTEIPDIFLGKEKFRDDTKTTVALQEVSELNSIGIMLPYTALHYLLLDRVDGPLVCTSSNISGQPITTHSKEQFAPYTLTHSRKILHGTDDSLMKVVGKDPLLIRRSRGYVPRSIKVPGAPKQTILALGAEMNSAFCILKDGRATLSQYLGNTSPPNVLKNYKKTLRAFLNLTHATPDHILCDLHPGYATSELALELALEFGVPLTKVQHHTAHAHSVAQEHGLKKFTAIVCDGLGYGPDGSIWGGEVFVGDKRVGHLEKQFQLGGDLATNDPDRMLFTILRKFLSQEETTKILKKRHGAKELMLWNKQLETKFNTPETSSCGRVLDAASALLGFPSERTYDGRAAMNLEAHATRPYPLKPKFQTSSVILAKAGIQNKYNILLTTPLFEYLIKNLHRDKKRLAATVHRYLAEGLYEIAKQYNLPITFSGGCAYNSHITKYLLRKDVLINKNIPPGDGGISFGQIIYFLKKK